MLTMGHDKLRVSHRECEGNQEIDPSFIYGYQRKTAILLGIIIGNKLSMKKYRSDGNQVLIIYLENPTNYAKK